jgi:hypothetical protein
VPVCRSSTLRQAKAARINHKLITGRVVEYDIPNSAVEERVVFTNDGFPEIVCSNVDVEIGNTQAVGTPVDLNVPKCGWPSGFWVIQMEVRQNEKSDWQLVTDENRCELAVLMSGSRPENLDEFRVVQFHRALPQPVTTFRSKKWTVTKVNCVTC